MHSAVPQVSCGDAAHVVGIDASGHVHAFSNDTGAWTMLSSSHEMRSVSIGGDGAIWGVDPSSSIWRWRDAEEWDHVVGTAAQSEASM